MVSLLPVSRSGRFFDVVDRLSHHLHAVLPGKELPDGFPQHFMVVFQYYSDGRDSVTPSPRQQRQYRARHSCPGTLISAARVDSPARTRSRRRGRCCDIPDRSVPTEGAGPSRWKDARYGCFQGRDRPRTARSPGCGQVGESRTRCRGSAPATWHFTHLENWWRCVQQGRSCAASGRRCGWQPSYLPGWPAPFPCKHCFPFQQLHSGENRKAPSGCSRKALRRCLLRRALCGRVTRPGHLEAVAAGR